MRRPLMFSALLTGLFIAAPASASARQFDLWTSTELTPGRAHTYGTIDFQYATRVTVSGRLNDVCNGDSNGDGFGAYLRATFVMDNGNTRTLSAKDTTGCKNPDGVDVWLTAETPRPIKAVRLYLYEYDADRNSTADTATKRFDAP